MAAESRRESEDEWTLASLTKSSRLCLLYIVANSAINLLNRVVLGKHGFTFPLTLTAVHMAFNTFLLVPVVLSSSTCWASLRKQWLALATIGVFNAAQIAFNNSSLSLMELPLNQVVRATMPIFVAAIRLIKAEPPPVHHVLLLFLISCGVHLVVRDVSTASNEWMGILMACSSVALQATQMSVAGGVLSDEVTAIQLISCSSPFAFFATVIPAVALEGNAFLAYVTAEPKFALAVLLGTAVLAVAYNVIMYNTIRQLNAVGSSVLGNVKVLLLVIVSKYLLHEMDWSARQYLGAVLTFGTSAIYSCMKLSTVRDVVTNQRRVVSGILAFLIVVGFVFRPFLEWSPAIAPWEELQAPAARMQLLKKTGVDPCRNLQVPEHLGNPHRGDDELVLITGGSGFIGSHLTEQLLSLGYRVRVFDSLETGNLQFLNLRDPKLEFHYGNIMDLEALRRAMVGVRGVFHLGAASKVLPSLKNPAMGTFNVERNSVGTSRVLEAANETKIVKKVMYAASSTYYGNQPVPHVETDHFMPTSPYAASKFMGELIMSTNDNLYKLHTLSLRFFMVYGPRNPSAGAYAIVTGKFIGRLKAGLPLMIEGDGTNFRDFVHADDISRALILGYQSHIHGTVINAGSGETHSVKEVADLVSSNQVHVAARKNDLLGTLADTCKAKQELHFQTRKDFVTVMKEMIADAKNGRSDYLAPMWEEASVQDKLDSHFGMWRNLTHMDRNEKLRAALDADRNFLHDFLLKL
eukprot:TRINITY_DN76452_c0_g1_i1.p1 TRINITY_DN76452_c0_g1~~TRINITY_DN76452_c0_g1_i1.p1  ORF type:complete len:759 (-),score=118.77 TRINITY_DN76452_c0_g1_i1:35-2281(-)